VDVSLVARGAHLAAMRANGLKLLIGDEERVVHPLSRSNLQGAAMLVEYQWGCRSRVTIRVCGPSSG